MSTEKKVGWFEELYGKGKEAFVFLSKGTKKKTLRIKFEEYYNSLESVLLEKKLANSRFQEKAAAETDSLTMSDFKTLCQNRKDIENIESQKTFIRAEFLEAFGREMKVDEE